MTEKKNNNRGTIVGLSIVIAILLGYIVYLHFNTNKLVDEKVLVEVERNQVMEDLEALQVEYQMMETSNDTLQAKINSQQQKIEEMLVEIKKHKGDAWTINKLKKETETLRVIMKGYLRTIDSLNTLNIALKTENIEIKGALAEEKKQSKELLKKTEDLSEVVSKGSKLQAMDLYATAIKIRSNGSQTETDKANKAEKIKSCFVLSENKITVPGEKSIYFRIISPEGKVLTDENSAGKTFVYDGVQGIYTMIRKVEYQNEALDVCIYWDIPETLSPGFYIVELYLEEVLIGKTSFDMK
jgi:chromosome segregation ATPase